MEHLPYRKKLFAYKDIYDQKGSKAIFIKAVQESINYHRANNDFYDKLCKSRDFHSHQIKSIDDLAKIPAIPVNFFKTHEIRSINMDQVEVHATSSGTLGQKSQVFLSKSDLKLGTKMAFKSMAYHKFISPLPTNYLLLGYEPSQANHMGNVKVLLGMTKLAPALKKTFALRVIGDDYQIDYFGIIKALQNYNRLPFPVRIYGFPAYLYMLLTTMKKMNMPPLNLGKHSLIFTGGGWKSFENMKIDKTQLHQLVEEMLGIPSENCRDFFSAVEHSVAYPECKHHHMHIPIWSRVIVRDLKSLEPVGYNTPGFLNFVSPLVSGMPLTSVIMGDLGILRHGSDCPCGISSPYFEVLGRAGTGAGKSCATTAAELIGGHNGTSI